MIRTFSQQSGFSLVELVLVIVILTIIASMAGPRFFDGAAFDERAYLDELGSAIRYAQKVAVATGCPVRVEITAGDYSLSQQQPVAGHCDPSDSSFPLPVLLPTGQVVAGTAPGGIVTTPSLTFSYDALGRTTLGADRILNVGARAITISAESGLVIVP